MQKAKISWDVERAAAWLRSHAWSAEAAADDAERASPAAGLSGEAIAEAIDEAAAEPADPLEEEIDIAGWPALVAPFYD